MYIAKKYILTIALMGFVVYPAQAALYEQTPPDVAKEAIFSIFGGQEVADDFVLSQDSTVTEVTWYGFFNDSAFDSGLSEADFTIDFLSDDSGLPGSSIGQRTVTAALEDTGWVYGGLYFGGRTIYKFTATLSSSSSVSIGASDKTWLSIVESDSDTTALWLWNRYDYSSSLAFIVPSASWDTANGNVAFSLDGTVVPVPGAFLLGILGLSVAGLKLRKST